MKSVCEPAPRPKAPHVSKALFSLCVATLLAGTAAGHAQSALDGFDPNANDTIRIVVTQPDGKILIGGDFTTLAPNGGATVARNHIARLNSDGTLDSGFNPDANNAVYAIAVQPDGKILAGGVFTSIGGQSRSFLARLEATTGAADSFDANANAHVSTLAWDASGKILAGGHFSSIGGQPRNRIARLDPASGLADSFDPQASNDVFSIVVQPNGKILAGGAFSTIGGQTRIFIARLDAATGAADSLNASPSNYVQTLALQADGKILLVGPFSTVSGQTRRGIARLDATSGAVDSFNANADQDIYAVAVQADGKFWSAALSPTSAGSRGVASLGWILRLHLRIPSILIRTQLASSSRSPSSRMGRFWRPAFSVASRGRRATMLPAWKRTAGSTRHSISVSLAVLFLRPLYSRTARLSSAVLLPAF